MLNLELKFNFRHLMYFSKNLFESNISMKRENKYTSEKILFKIWFTSQFTFLLGQHKQFY